METSSALAVRQKQSKINLNHMTRRYAYAKRTLDFVASFAALVILALPFFIIALCIKIDDPKGGVFYSQVRLGKNGKEFRMWKFRSMVSNADQMVDQLIEQNEVTGAMFKIKEDPRITKVGRVLRKYSLDELPQLYNILKGEMSLVGPRPPLPREVADYTPHDMQRLRVIPGATGLWQVSGRSDVGFEDMVELDIKYINKACFWMDLEILMKTFVVFVKPNGAY